MPRIRKLRGPFEPLADRLTIAHLAPPPLVAWARWGGRLGWLLLCPKRPAGGFRMGDKEEREASPRREVAARLAEVGQRLPFLQEIELWHPRGGWMRVEEWQVAQGTRR